ncbi:YveK family protein [Salinicoccus roseus]|uniref:YveK family protein n=1 Tax=Salinicoccus roseus TaxID=45670 RepID=UPI000F4E0B07|nr:Wzz/FepE/Etk N-terminal domain-containing protein [Salinicoccus roseus]RPE54749.1 capsular polysaccharide biosynthesis protein [Salinicoccus roseus]GGA62952.1 putative capsular polysaccharide biosynthesis protein YwqC [Salinicoccus roseus]
MEESVNIDKALEIIKKNIALIIGSMVVVGVLAALVTYFIMTPKYESETQMLVSSPGDAVVVDSENIETNLQLIHTYREIMLSRTILEDVITNLELDETVKELSKRISVTNQEQSQVLSIRVIDESAEEAVAISNEIAEAFQERIVDIMYVDNLSIYAPASVGPDMEPVSPQPLLNIAIGLFSGLMLGLILAFARDHFDKSVRNESEVRNILDLPVVGSITRIED